MLIRYDKEADAKYITFLPRKAKKGVVVRTQKVHPWLLVDYDKEGNVFGIEILNASQHLAATEVFGDSSFTQSVSRAESDYKKGLVKKFSSLRAL